MNRFKKAIWELWVNGISGSGIIPGRLRIFMYRLGGMNIKNAGVRSGCVFNGTNIEIKDGAFINHNTFVNCYEKVTIGKNVYVAFDVLITTNSHEVGDPTQRAINNVRSPINIGDGTWIGARATILPGVTIGEGCIIAAGAVVNKDCKPNGMYAGVPAKRIKELPIKEHLNNVK
ncbi:MAG: acyltransferase [Lactococcus lactis]|nr:acyltransferase [Tetragenococcus halophilus]MDN6390042.1 acyltransferase [Lactococcus lactis]MDN6611735.1 acyltransferase [Staphylococcus equorum]MDN6640518.1 acyltransferase [Tetragenococcus sp.]MDN6735955.1 acyltransferase [Tetragenococcus koreensis]